MTAQGTDLERRAHICREHGIRIEDLTTWVNEGAEGTAYHYGCCVGKMDVGVTVGTGFTPALALDDLIDQLEE